MHTTVLGGSGAALPLIRAILGAQDPAADTLTVVANTSTDMTVHGLRACPDLDAVMTGSGGQPAAEVPEPAGNAVTRELAAHGVDGLWFELDDVEIATMILRTRLLSLGYPLDEVTRAIAARWRPPLTLLPMSNDPIETHMIVDAEGSPRAAHVQEWLHTRFDNPAPAAAGTRPNPAEPGRLAVTGLEAAKAAPGVLDALRTADLILLAPVDPVLYLSPLLGLPAVSETLAGTRALVLGCEPAPADVLFPGARRPSTPAWSGPAEWHAPADPAELAEWALSHPGRKAPAAGTLWGAPAGPAGPHA